ncbi:MAG: DNA-protecting protein DprA [Candidatus Eremiobacteraeota bacterium]|nr:DNA-protecting protein DprA [Candidatus Eremiobacteraeota bacterium]
MPELSPEFVPADAIEHLRGSRSSPIGCPGLYVCGELKSLSAITVAIVGTRAASAQGRRCAHVLAADLGARGITILSGLALGIDAAAHEGALSASGPTVAVLGGGHRRFFPARNAGLCARILAASGAVLSPYPPDRPAMPYQFLERNGVVAALADAVVVVEAPARSGALNTASWAAGRIPVMAMPGDVERPSVAGCLALIRDGATLVRDARDVLEELRIATEPDQPRLPLAPLLDPLELVVWTTLTQGEADFNHLIALTSITAPQLLAALTRLELSGHIEQRPGARYACTNLRSSL